MRLLIVWHSATGGTRQMAEAAFEGAAIEPSVDVRILTAGLATGSLSEEPRPGSFAPKNEAHIHG